MIVALGGAGDIACGGGKLVPIGLDRDATDGTSGSATESATESATVGSAGGSAGGTGGGDSDGALPPPPGIALPGVHFVEPFEYHYPDEVAYDDVATKVEIKLSLGEYEPGTFVYLPPPGVVPGEVAVRTRDLFGPRGEVFPAESLAVGVVVHMDRSRAGRLDMVWRGGVSATGSSPDSRGFHQDAKERLPVVPCVIVADAVQFAAGMKAANPHVILPESTVEGGGFVSRAPLVPGRAVQFWVTAHVPETFVQTERRRTYAGALELAVAGTVLEVPIEVEVLALRLDRPADHGVEIGPVSALDNVPASYHDVILQDLSAHGVNALRITEGLLVNDEGLLDRIAAVGMNKVAVGTPSAPTPERVASLTSRGFEPTFLSEGLWEADTVEVEEDVAFMRSVHAVGGRVWEAGTYRKLLALVEQEPVDEYTFAFTTYELDGLPAAEFEAFLGYLDGRRDGTVRSLASRETHYAEVWNGHAPLLARLLSGFWLFRSGLGGVAPWGYAEGFGSSPEDNPFVRSDYEGIAFPAAIVDAAGEVTRLEMLPSVTWEALREGVDDLRYASTVQRLLDARGPDSEEARLFRGLLADYAAYRSNGDRVDYRNRESEVRATRYALFELLARLSGA